MMAFPGIGRRRFAEPTDAPAILEIITESMAKNFRIECIADVNVLIENSVMSICQLDTNDAIIGFLSAKDHPLMPCIHPCAWEDYVWAKYKAIELRARNTLFLHLLCWDPNYGRNVTERMLKSVFMHDPHIEHIVMIKPFAQYHFLNPDNKRAEGSFRRVQALAKNTPADKLPHLWIADRSDVCPRLRVRRAVEEDNDDIIPILERHSPKLKELYGEFYISELIARHPESDRVLIVCEHNEVAVGVMCLNTQINYAALEEAFELSPFGGLKHLQPNTPKVGPEFLDSVYNFMDPPCAYSQGNLMENMGSTYHMVNERGNKQDKNIKTVSSKVMPPPTPSKVSWISEEEKEGGFAKNLSATYIDYLNMLEDEDELEFDIVNIETDLLRVPRLLSYDMVSHGPSDYFLKMIGGPGNRARESVNEEYLATSSSKIKKMAASIGGLGPAHSAEEPVRYTGTPNAFLLELFAMHPDYDERYGFDMLTVSFELFPNRDYCVVCLPTNDSAFPLLEHFTLVTPYANKLKFINESLYVTHVNSIRGILRVRPGEMFDLYDMAGILEHAPRRQSILDLFHSSLHSNSLSSHVLLSENEPVGVVVLGPLDEATVVRTQYELSAEPVLAGTDGAILAGVMSPVFEPHARWFMRDILRQSKYSNLFWVCRIIAKGDAGPGRNLISLIGSMTPVRPRRSMPDTGIKELEVFFKDLSMPFALWCIDKPLTSLPKVDVNTSIVVVGSSRVGLAFLETLLMGPSSRYLSFTNVTLVSVHGLPTVAECLRAADTSVPRRGRYTDRYLKSVPFCYYLDVISGLMVSIDRKNKCIHLKGGQMKYYDILVLTCGVQYQPPGYLSESLEHDKEMLAGAGCVHRRMDNPKYQPDRVPVPPDMPENVLLINSIYEANLALRRLLRLISDTKEDKANKLDSNNRIIVYGECEEVYSCIAALLELGITADMIAFVEPFPPEDDTIRVNCFNDEEIDTRVQASIEKLGIRVYRHSWFSSWSLKGGKVKNVRFFSRMHTYQLKCFALFYYGQRAIDIYAFKAINGSGLVYDGGLVVGAEFETNDPHIFAAGPCTKYTRRLYADRYMQKYYSSEDVGESLANLFLRTLDPFVSAQTKATDIYETRTVSMLPRYSSGLCSFMSSHLRVAKPLKKWRPVYKFESPIFSYATFPGPLCYMRIRKPGPDIPREAALSLPQQGHALVTEKNGNYFRLQLNSLHVICEITCLSKKKFLPDRLLQLYGKHESFYNKLLVRYKMGLIDDLYEYFTQPWQSLCYQETFDEMLFEIQEQEIVMDHAEEPRRFMSMIDRYIGGPLTVENVKILESLEIPSECGQCKKYRGMTLDHWNEIGGENIVMSHVSKSIQQNSITTPNYAQPDPNVKYSLPCISGVLKH